MEKPFNELYMRKVEKLKPARTMMVGMQEKSLGMLCINLYEHYAMHRHLHSHLYLHRTWYIFFRER